MISGECGKSTWHLPLKIIFLPNFTNTKGIEVVNDAREVRKKTTPPEN